MIAFAQKLEKYKNIGPGFDALRIGLAISIIGVHSFLLTNNFWVNQSPFWFTEYALVPMFFALSGFLVTASAMRLSLRNFLINRGLRIIPALATDTLICALLIGPLVTNDALKAYFTDSRFHSYFLNSIGLIHFYLPGVFVHQPTSIVNGALWTVPCELSCYIIMSFLIVTGWINKPIFGFIVAVGFLVASWIVQYLYVHHAAGRPPYIIRALDFFIATRRGQVVAAFLIGSVFYQLRYHIPYSWRLFIACCALCLVAVFTLNFKDVFVVGNRFILLPALVYMTIFLGLTEIKIPSFLHRGDYSYGVYLYHYPLLQVLVGLLPVTIALKGFGPIILYALALPVVFAFAWFSWHVIEKPILTLRKNFSMVAKVRGGEPAQSAIKTFR